MYLKLYAAPHDVDYGILEVDTDTRTVSTIPINATVGMWAGIVEAPNGKLYAMPTMDRMETDYGLLLVILVLYIQVLTE